MEAPQTRLQASLMEAPQTCLQVNLIEAGFLFQLRFPFLSI